MTNHPPLVIVISSRGLVGLLASCLHALHMALDRLPQGFPWKIVVADNASQPPLEQALLSGSIDVLRYDHHRCFSGVVNDVATAHPGSDLVLVNNDVLVHPRAMTSLVELSTDPRVGVAGSRLIYPDGTIQHIGVAIGLNGPYHPMRHHESAGIPRALTRPIAVTGALMLIKRLAFDSVGGFDEGYDFGSEDVDFCHRVRAAGWEIVCDHSIDSLHFESMTPGRSELDVESRRRYRDIWSHRVPLSRKDFT